MIGSYYAFSSHSKWCKLYKPCELIFTLSILKPCHIHVCVQTGSQITKEIQDVQTPNHVIDYLIIYASHERVGQ
jgi:hypothetical protein